MGYFIDDTAKVIDSKLPENLKVYRNVVIQNSECKDNVSIGDDSSIVNCLLEENCVINRRNYINDSHLGAFSYTGINTIINYTKIGKFCSIARNVDIGGFDHASDTFSMMPLFRFNQAVKEQSVHGEIDFNNHCCIGNDVWIAAGAQILNKVSVGDGAIIGAGAVVTKDVEPYAVVAGVPARKIKSRFSDDIIEDLLELQWWNWPLEIILDYMEKLIQTKVTKDTILQMKEIAKRI